MMISGYISTELELILRLLAAAFLGGLIGFERERLSWAAGLRTHMLVCVGACLIMIVSAHGFSEVMNNPHVSLDPSRMAAQVVSGIGFLGAGAIMLRGEVVRGLTTAASIWAVAAVGLAVGGGMYLEATAATFIMLFILAMLKPLSEKYRDSRQLVELHLHADHGTITLETLGQVLGQYARRIRQVISQQSETPGTDEIIITLPHLPPKEIMAIVQLLSKAPTVQEVREVQS